MRWLRNPGTLGTAWWRRGPLITEDANTVAHVIWRNGALVDLKGNSWTQNGTVPQVAAVRATPPGAGPFAFANWYSLGAGADVLDFAGGTFSAAVIGQITSLPATTGALLDNGTIGTEGWVMHVNTSGTILVATYGGGGGSAQSAVALVPGQTFIAFIGLTAGTLFVKLNGGVMASGAAGMTPGTSSQGKIGTNSTRNFTGIIYEAWASSTAPSDALFTSILGQVNSRLRRSL